MRSGVHRLRGIFLGGVTAITSSAIVLGSFVLAFTEGGRSFAPAPSPTIQATSLSTRLPPTLPPPTASPTPLPSSTPTATPTTQATLLAASCPPPPENWIPITIERGDKLRDLAEAYGTTQDELVEANCLAVSQLEPGTILYVPGFIPTSPPERCGPPSDWRTIYIVQSGDTLFELHQRLGVTVDDLKWANCLSSNTIRVGQRLYVPFQPPSPRPSPTHRPTATRPPPPTDTPPPLPTPTPTEGIIIHPSTPPPPSAASGTTSAP